MNSRKTSMESDAERKISWDSTGKRRISMESNGRRISADSYNGMDRKISVESNESWDDRPVRYNERRGGRGGQGINRSYDRYKFNGDRNPHREIRRKTSHYEQRSRDMHPKVEEKKRSKSEPREIVLMTNVVNAPTNISEKLKSEHKQEDKGNSHLGERRPPLPPTTNWQFESKPRGRGRGRGFRGRGGSFKGPGSARDSLPVVQGRFEEGVFVEDNLNADMENLNINPVEAKRNNSKYISNHNYLMVDLLNVFIYFLRSELSAAFSH